MSPFRAETLPDSAGSALAGRHAAERAERAPGAGAASLGPRRARLPAALHGSLPPGACAAPAGSTSAEGRADPGGAMAGAGREELGEATRAVQAGGGGSGRGAAGWRLAAGRRGGGVSAGTGLPAATPPPLQERWFGPPGMRCGTRRTEAGGMNHPTWSGGGRCAAVCPLLRGRIGGTGAGRAEGSAAGGSGAAVDAPRRLSRTWLLGEVTAFAEVHGNTFSLHR